jgi:hypothetical protein
MRVNGNPVGRRGKHASISTDIAGKVKDDVVLRNMIAQGTGEKLLRDEVLRKTYLAL